MKKIVLFVAILVAFAISSAKAVTQAEIDAAIAGGLKYLAYQQDMDSPLMLPLLHSKNQRFQCINATV